MKTIIAGGRDFWDFYAPKPVCYRFLVSSMETLPWVGDITEVVSGTAKGADTYGEHWYALMKVSSMPDLELARFPADWNKHGRRAGHIRNAQMGDYADALVALWDGVSRGTLNMIDYARKKGLVVQVFYYDSLIPPLVEKPPPSAHKFKA